MPALEPNDALFVRELSSPPPVVERLSPAPPDEYNDDVAMGRYVGVCGRELFAELTLDDDAVLAAEWRDCCFRILLDVLWYNGSAFDAMLCVGMALVDCIGRYDALFPRGLDARRRSLSFSFSVIFTRTGEGESSIIKTQPELSFFSFDLSDATLS